MSRKLSLLVITLVTLSVAVSASRAAKDILRIERIVTPENAPHTSIDPGMRKEYISDVSRRNLLKLEREHPGALPYARNGLPIEAYQEGMAVDTLTVLGLRVEFQEENPDDPLSTGNGLFDMRDTTTYEQQEGHYFDSSPHDSNYFAKHMEAMAHYWWEMSNHTLHINWEIWPPGVDSTYQVSRTMKEYQEDNDYQIQNVLGDYFREVVALADSVSPDIDFSLPGSPGVAKPIIIFHPGSDWQNDFAGDTPHDFPTGFLFLFGIGVVVDDGAVIVSEGIVMPETVTQDRSVVPWRVNVLNGAMAHEFGHALGDRDLYNTCQFTTRIGDFSLKDNNYSDKGGDIGRDDIYLYGFLPGSEDIWHKAYLGFVKPVEVSNVDDIGILATGIVTNDTKCIRIPIDAFEYFICENRQVEFDFIEDKRDDVSPGFENAIIIDQLTSVVMGPGYAIDSSGTKVKVLNGEYDRLLFNSERNPYGGLLIFHVDEMVAYADYWNSGIGNWHTNALQCDTSRWFMRVMEADPFVSFGNLFHETTYGSTDDLFPYEDRNSLTPDTRPFSTASNSGANTGIYITDISATDTFMTFSVRTDHTMAGWPKNTVPGLTEGSHPVIVDADGNGDMEIFQANWRVITAFHHDGSGLMPRDTTLQLTSFDLESTFDVRLKVFAWSPEPYVYIGSPSVGDIDGDGANEVVIAADDSLLYAYEIYDNDNDNLADLVSGFPVDLGALPTANYMLADYDGDAAASEIYVATTDGAISVYDNSGNKMASVNDIPGKIKGIAAGLDTKLIAFTANPPEDSSGSSYIGVADLQTGDVSWQDEFNVYLYEPVIADLDLDDSEDIIVSSAEGLIAVFTITGQEKLSWWAVMDDSLGSCATVADIDRNGYPEIVIPGNNKIHCYSHTGAPFQNFPAVLDRIVPEGLIASPVSIGDVDDDGKPDIVFGGPDRDVYAFGHDGKLINGFPMAVSVPVNAAPIVADLDGDGSVNIGGRGDADGYLNVWDLYTDYNDSLNIWRCYGGGAVHRFYHSVELLATPVSDGELLPSVYAWPNPTNDNISHIHYRIDRNVEADVNIKIFDTAGNLMGEYNTTGTGPADNEYVWNCGSFASGVYLARVEVNAAGESKHKFTKIAIVR